MSERQRAFRALRGDALRRVGDRGIYSEGFSHIDAEFADDHEREVEVLRVSDSGKTIWTRFVHPEGYVRYGHGREPQKWMLSDGHYWGSDPLGEVSFR